MTARPYNLQFSEPQPKSTRRGDRFLREAQPTPAFWIAWKKDKDALKEAGYSVFKKDHGGFIVSFWSESKDAEPPEPVAIPTVYSIQKGSGYGGEPFQVGDVVINRGRKIGSMREKLTYDELSQIREEATRSLPALPVPQVPQLMGMFNFSDGSQPRWGENPNYEAEEASYKEAKAAYEQRDAERKAAIDAALAAYPLDGPEYLYVLDAHEQYIREDGMSFGVGEESGYVYSATLRAATDEEAAPLKAKCEAAQRQHEATTKLKQVWKRIFDEGQRPSETVSVSGETIYLSQSDHNSRLYGGGRWFEITDNHVWAVRNNGNDGDDWSINNFGTGGAGAVAASVPRTVELVAEIIGLSNTVNESA